jgi:hypothetical protein
MQIHMLSTRQLKLVLGLVLGVVGFLGNSTNANAQLVFFTRIHEPPQFERTSVQLKTDHTWERAGCAQEYSKLARSARLHTYAIGMAGGGKLVKGDGPAVDGTDGIFGWDYVGIGPFARYPGRIFLHWHHNRPNQPPPGSYNADTPRVFDVLTIRPVRRAILEKEAERRGGEE